DSYEAKQFWKSFNRRLLGSFTRVGLNRVWLRVMDASRVNQAGKEIQILVRERCGGRPDEETRKRIYQLADDARYAAEHDGYMEEKAAGVKYFADVLYSHRKHAKYAEKHASYASRRE